MTEQLSQELPKGETVTRMFPAREWVKVRAATDGQQAYTVWNGAIYALVPGAKKQHLFNIVGMSVARRLPTAEGEWDFTSRELTFYLDPATQELVHQWQNPWTGETVTVMHVANSPVQGHFKGEYPAKVTGDRAAYVFDIFPTYPNPLAENPEFAPYSADPTYQAVELFKLTVALADLLHPDSTTVKDVIVSWSRIGPWLPWMKLGNQPGQLIYSASGYKVQAFADLPRLIQEQIQSRVPLFRNAPDQKLDQEDMTSWSYFKQHFAAYLRGEVFPMPAPADSE